MPARPDVEAANAAAEPLVQLLARCRQSASPHISRGAGSPVAIDNDSINLYFQVPFTTHMCMREQAAMEQCALTLCARHVNERRTCGDAGMFTWARLRSAGDRQGVQAASERSTACPRL